MKAPVLEVLFNKVAGQRDSNTGVFNKTRNTRSSQQRCSLRKGVLRNFVK